MDWGSNWSCALQWYLLHFSWNTQLSVNITKQTIDISTGNNSCLTERRTNTASVISRKIIGPHWQSAPKGHNLLQVPSFCIKHKGRTYTGTFQGNWAKYSSHFQCGKSTTQRAVARVLPHTENTRVLWTKCTAFEKDHPVRCVVV